MTTVFIVDDSKLVTDIITMRLTMAGYSVRTASTGEDALTQIANDPPDLVLLDLHLPGVDGRYVLHQIRSNPTLDNVRVVVMTSNELSTRINLTGVDDYVDKDVDLLALPSRIKVLLETP